MFIGGPIDIAEGAPPPAPQGVTRIARIAGVLQQSTDGSNYQPLSSGANPSTPSGPGPRIGSVLFLSEGAVSPPRLGVTRIARFGGQVMQSVDGAPWVSLTAVMAPSAPASQGYGPGLAGVDLVEGQYAPAPQGVTLLARTGGVLATSTDGGSWSQLVPSLPGTPTLNFDASNLDGSNNSTLTSGSQFGTANNLGSAGAAGNAVQATGVNKPTFLSSIGGLPAIQFSGNQWLSSGAITAFTQPSLVGIVVRSETLPAVEFFCDGRIGGGTARQTILQESGVAQMASNSIVSGGTMTAQKFSIIICNFNGASSSLQLDGSTTSPLNAGTFALDGITLGASNAGAGPLTGYIRQLVAYTGAGQPTAAQLLTALQAKWGVTPN